MKNRKVKILIPFLMLGSVSLVSAQVTNTPVQKDTAVAAVAAQSNPTIENLKKSVEKDPQD